MRENVAILYRGASFELGRGERFYGIWPIGHPLPQPAEWWPDSQEGWASAWARFTLLEPGAITPVSMSGQAPPPPAAPPWQAASHGHAGFAPAPPPPGQTAPGQTAPGYAPAGPHHFGPPGGPGGAGAPRGYGRPPAPPRPYGQSPAYGQALPPGSRTRAMVAAGLLAAGVGAGIVGLFTSYLGATIASTADELVPHVIYLAAWAVSAVLVIMGPARQRIGALAGLGVSVVTFGLFAADLGTAVSAHSATAGMWPSLIGWLLATLGAAAGYHRAAAGAPARPRRQEAGPLIMLLIAGAGAAVAFAPAWDRFTVTAASGGSRTITAGNAFSSPGLVITGDVLVMAALVAVAAVAALWRPPRLGAALLAGATIPMAAQAISALVQLHEASPAAQVGLSPSQASAAGLTVTAGPTPVFWIYCIFVGALIACCAWLLLAPAAGPAASASPWATPPAQGHPPIDDRTPVLAGATATATATTSPGTITSPGTTAVSEPPVPSEPSGPASPASTRPPEDPAP